jgi:NAD-dependent SIR2 family protein deacetylase
VSALADVVRTGGVVVLSGAGLSTDSGIPDYRGPAGRRRRPTPMTYQEFVGSPAARQRYWARSHLGWRVINRAQPNDGHRAVAALQRLGLVDGIVTQNVDGLHQVGGARDVVELHGSLDDVVCLGCGTRTDRAWLHARLAEANPDFDDEAPRANPDGDVDLVAERVAAFRLVPCTVCGADLLKPDVVFFGESVPRERVAHCFDLVDAAGSLLVLGSSLAVMSGYRFVRRAAARGIPVLIVTAGETRGDPQATLKVDAPLGEVLPRLVRAVAPG